MARRLPGRSRLPWSWAPTGARGPATRAVRTVVDGLSFASKKEARRWQQLGLLVRARAITDLRRQVRLALHAHGGALVGHYVADFVYVEGGATVIEDVKGAPRTSSGAIGRTDLYEWKRRHVAAEYGYTIREV